MSKVKLGSPSGDVLKEYASLPFSEFVKDSSAILSSSGPLDSPEKHPQSPLKHDTSASSLLLGSKSDDILETLSSKIHDKRRAKKILRNGTWPPDHPIRYKLWKLLAELFSKLFHHHEVYTDALRCVFGDEMVNNGIESIVTLSLPSFVDRRFISTHYLSSKGVQAVHRIMVVISFERPDVIYCPTLFSLAAILLHYFSEEECYSCVSSLVTKKCKERFVTQSRTAYEASGFVFKKLALKYCKSSCHYLERCGVEVDAFFEDWIFWVLNHLPFGHLVRVIDCYLYEGPKILYRVGLAILVNFHKNRGVDDDDRSEPLKGPDVGKRMELYCASINITPNKLLKTAFGFRGLSRSLMMRLITKQEMCVSSRDNAAILQTNVPSSTSTGSLNMLVSTTTNSQLLSRKERIYDWLPTRMTLKRPNLIFSTSEHGTSLITFYSKIEGHDPTLIVIQTSTDDLIGCYCTGDWIERRKNLGSSGTNSKYFGSGENFVFTLHPKTAKYGWVGLNVKLKPGASFFATGDSSRISIGGGNGEAIYLDDCLCNGSTNHCDTFDNPPLVVGGRFKVHILEVFEFV
ncbi:hypothetical protein HELRODRAFT_115966 [Helobdella robusta]|uniref:TLDc domain-containing protein n=1 Tax=Helobdella robusta TaxID=6412 RepID=T1EGC1_HELRO|nr:hypothetical protein HELRODRAFT_115966 [Helobdella robusta]ESN92336.1 hypothetical protein HELRODRAFT_115966 [Helobdella robusta]